MHFEAHTRVRLKTAPDKSGRITGRTREHAGRTRYEVDFGHDSDWVLEGNLEVAPERKDIFELLSQAAYGRVRNLRSIITHARLTGSLADLIYSMEASNTDFYPYQFKPVLNFLDSPSQGILIADEVGLGKTIEAGLIWTELRARSNANKLLVLCPSRLKEKWQQELIHKFGIKADICSARELLTVLKNQEGPGADGFAVIASLEGVRPPKGWEDDPGINRDSALLARYLESKEAEDSIFDCVVVDEAHYLRNPATQAHKLLRFVRPTTESLVLLSATPIQLKSDDLFQLLNLIDAESFEFVESFRRILEANQPLVELAATLRGKVLDRASFISTLTESLKHPLLSESRQIRHMLENPPQDEELKDPSVRVRLAGRIEKVNLLARTVTRSRKRDVQKNRVIRLPHAPQVTMTATEREFYEEVTEVVRIYCEDRGLAEGFIQTIPQRQMCSSIPAAFRAWSKKMYDDPDFLFESGVEREGSSVEKSSQVGPLVSQLAAAVSKFCNYSELKANDSKYRMLLVQLKDYWRQYPEKKVILFSYYRETLHYLKDRLDEDQISASVIMGGMKHDTYSMIEKFRKDSSVRILLSSEVASEGVDLQFSSFLINYDLPWNPMRVEQRIGRIDRIGQQEDRINILNFFYADTLDDRIYNRLYERLDIFRYAFGDLEAILGEKINQLTSALLSHRLTREDEEKQIEQTRLAIAQKKQEQEVLEEEAVQLAAHGDYVLNQVKAAREMRRYIDPSTLWFYVRDFMLLQYPGTQLIQLSDEPLVVDVELSREAKVDLQHYLEQHRAFGRTRLVVKAAGQRIQCIFSSHVDLASTEQEVINQHHPLVRFIIGQISTGSFHPLVAARIGERDVPGIGVGQYLLIVGRWSTTGAKTIEKMVYRGFRKDGAVLDDDDSERLITSAMVSGSDWGSVAADVDRGRVVEHFQQLLDVIDDQFNEYAEIMKLENEDRVDQLITNLERKTSSRIQIVRETMAKQAERGITRMIPANEGRIRKAETYLADRTLHFEKQREISTVRNNVLASVINVS